MATGEQHIYRLIQDGLHFQENSFLSGTELRILLSLYVDDFEVCNPLGSSRRLWVICLLVHIHHCSKFTLPSYAKLLIWTSMVMTGFYVHFSKVLKLWSKIWFLFHHLEKVLKARYMLLWQITWVLTAQLVLMRIYMYMCRFYTGTKTNIQTKEVKLRG